ncbi:MAG: hypothetical protein ACRDSE_13515 [Pseudonocardiaceae bacterium]
MAATHEHAKDAAPACTTPRDRLPVWRVGTAGGLVGTLCRVGPTVLALTTWLGTFA